jgi:predicted CoA-substrate-specific enzyme activase
MNDGLFAGIDSGSTTTKIVMVDGGGKVLFSACAATGARPAQSAEQMLRQALEAVAGGGAQPAAVVATGYGRALVGKVTKTVTEITCHARGARQAVPGCRTVIDIGGQDSKVIRLDPSGNVADFAMNDKCAAGTGRFLDLIAARLEVRIEELGSLALAGDSQAQVTSTCAVFAESEVVSLLSQAVPPAAIARGVVAALARRITALANQVGPVAPVVFTGGVALNSGLAAELGAGLGHKLIVAPDPQLVGALGAALLAAALPRP